MLNTVSFRLEESVIRFGGNGFSLGLVPDVNSLAYFCNNLCKDLCKDLCLEPHIDLWPNLFVQRMQ